MSEMCRCQNQPLGIQPQCLTGCYDERYGHGLGESIPFTPEAPRPLESDIPVKYLPVILGGTQDSSGESIEPCRVYWGSHGCDRPRGHDGPHLCLSCRTDDEDGWVGAPPYYGPGTRFYGEEAESLGLPLTGEVFDSYRKGDTIIFGGLVPESAAGEWVITNVGEDGALTLERRHQLNESDSSDTNPRITSN